MPKRSDKENVKTELCKILNKTGAMQFGAFKLTSGKLSPYYIDLRMVPSFPDAFQRICGLFVSFIKEEIGETNFDRIAGIPVAGIPFASLVAYLLRKPFLYIRRGVRLHGRQKRIEGVIAPGDNILLVDDLITTGLSLAKGAIAMVAEGGLVTEAAVLIDRQEGGRGRMEKQGVRVHALLDISEMTNVFVELGTIDEQQAETILKQTKKK